MYQHQEEYFHTSLQERFPHLKLRVISSVHSTQTLAKEAGRNGVAEDALFLAFHQTDGRGRLGRSFYSPEETGLYFSLLLHPSCCMEESLLLTVASAVALAEAGEAVTNETLQIKWVNDLYRNEKKVAGILTEGTSDGQGGLSFAVVGVGINLLPPKQGFPAEIADRAGTLWDTTPVKAEEAILHLLSQFLERFFTYYRALQEKAYLRPYRNRLYPVGKEVALQVGEQTVLGTVLGVTDDFALEFLKKDGTVSLFHSAEILRLTLK